jgi:hypothetical protein
MLKGLTQRMTLPQGARSEWRAARKERWARFADELADKFALEMQPVESASPRSDALFDTATASEMPNPEDYSSVALQASRAPAPYARNVSPATPVLPPLGVIPFVAVLPEMARAAPLHRRLSQYNIFNIAHQSHARKMISASALMIVFSVPAGFVVFMISTAWWILKPLCQVIPKALDVALFRMHTTTVDRVDQWRMGWIRWRAARHARAQVKAMVKERERQRKRERSARAAQLRSWVEDGDESDSSWSPAGWKPSVPPLATTRRPDSLCTTSTESTLPPYPGSGGASVASVISAPAESAPSYH